VQDHNATRDPTEVVLEFANTHTDGGGRPERFGDAAGLRSWLDQVTWLDLRPDTDGATTLTDADALEARQLRDALVTVLLTHSDDRNVDNSTAAEAEALLRRATQRYPLTADIDRHGARLWPLQDGLPGVLGRVLACIAELSLAGQWSRLKACRNPPCHFAFFDKTRNTSAGYCSPQCASQSSMRAYRQRQRAAAGGDATINDR
jgi:predicted RNA-binding Zn ribbon-like protein